MRLQKQSLPQKLDSEIGSLHFSTCLLTGPAIVHVEARKQLVELVVSDHSLLTPCGALEEAQGLAAVGFLLRPLPPQECGIIV